MLSIMSLEAHGVAAERGPILVTGAGVGDVAIHLLHRLGYQVIAATGRAHEADYLYGLGATEVIDRGRLTEPGKPLAKAVWAGTIDNAGSHTLANACVGTMDDGVVVSCGLAQGMDFPGSVAPFILRGLALVGINSVNRPLSVRDTVWRRVATLPDQDVCSTIGLTQAIEHAERPLDGQILGRLVVDTDG